MPDPDPELVRTFQRQFARQLNPIVEHFGVDLTKSYWQSIQELASKLLDLELNLQHNYFPNELAEMAETVAIILPSLAMRATADPKMMRELLNRLMNSWIQGSMDSKAPELIYHSGPGGVVIEPGPSWSGQGNSYLQSNSSKALEYAEEAVLEANNIEASNAETISDISDAESQYHDPRSNKWQIVPYQPNAVPLDPNSEQGPLQQSSKRPSFLARAWNKTKSRPIKAYFGAGILALVVPIGGLLYHYAMHRNEGPAYLTTDSYFSNETNLNNSGTPRTMIGKCFKL